jgi:hypothetical protein
MRLPLLPLFALLAMSVPLSAQAADARAPLTLSERLQLTSLLPIRTAELRDAGVTDTTVRRILDLFRAHQVDPVQADQILVVERDAAREHGPTDNFGAFVQQQLAAGKRGRALSDAIRAEHRTHGHRPMKHKAKPGQQGENPKEPGDHPEYKNPPGQGQSDHDRRPN